MTRLAAEVNSARASGVVRLAAAPYWWRGTDIGRQCGREELPAACDVAVVGSGVAGLSCAIELAQHGVRVCVFDAGPLCGGASSRNFGTAGAAGMLVYPQLRATIGAELAARLLREQEAALDEFVAFARRVPRQAELRQDGVMFLATDADRLNALRHACESSAAISRRPACVVRGADLENYFRTDAYPGAVLLPDAVSFNPGLLMRGLAESARDAGVRLFPNHEIASVQASGTGMRLDGANFRIGADRVVVAINGYLLGVRGRPVRRFERDVVPVEANMIATAELRPETLDAAIPSMIAAADTRRNFFCVRRSPDGRRVLFASRTGVRMSAVRRAAALRGDLACILPQLAGAEIEFSWSGMIAVTRDRSSHRGVEGNVGFVSGCNGSGMLRHFTAGRRVARRLLGLEATDDTDVPLPSLPWGLPKRLCVRIATTWMAAQDRRDLGGQARLRMKARR